MATRNANILGVKFDDYYRGGAYGGVATVDFDLLSAAFTGGTDTIQLGGAGYVNGVANTDTLAVILSKQRRDGKTVTLTGVAPGGAGSQAAATNGPNLFVQAAALSAGNVISATLNTTTPTGGSAVTAAASSWELPASLAVAYILS